MARHSELPVDPIFLARWSPRAFTGEAIPEAELMTLIEAARWAPSAYNVQPWRFLLARRDTTHWETFLGLLAPANRTWVERAAALLVLVSAKTMRPPGKDEDVPSISHSLDAGAAWGYLALQAAMSGWAAHGMVGFDFARTASELNVPDTHKVEAMIAIGRQGPADALPDNLRAREAPNDRRPLAEVAWEGRFTRD